MIRQLTKAVMSAYVSEYYSNQNFLGQSKEAVFIGCFQGKGDIYRSFLHFDLDVFQNSQALIERGHPVFLQLCIARNEVKKGAVQASIYRVSSAWDPYSVTWNTQPAHLPNPDLNFLVPQGWTGLILINANSLVNDWLKGSFPNHGLMIKGNEKRNSLVSFRTDEYTGLRSAPVIFL